MKQPLDFAARRAAVVKELQIEGILHNPAVAHAFRTVPRERFLPEDVRAYAYVDAPISIGFGQTTSALHMTVLFCEYGELKAGDRVLEVGGGCGYMSCIYAELVAPTDPPGAPQGHVWSAEIIPGLAEVGKGNVDRAGYADRVTFLQADASMGLDDGAPYNVIIVASAAPEVPVELKDQLEVGGVLLIPVGHELLRISKGSGSKFETERLGGVAFVPLRGKRGWRF